MYYTETKVRRINRRFYHPSTDKLLTFVRPGNNEHVTHQLREQLQHVKKTCDTCQRFAASSNRFRVSLPKEDCVFDRTVGMDIMKIDRRSVLHVVDKYTKFSAAKVLNGESSDKVCETFLSCWVAKYVEFPATVVLDQEPSFKARSSESFSKQRVLHILT